MKPPHRIPRELRTVEWNSTGFYWHNDLGRLNYTTPANMHGGGKPQMFCLDCGEKRLFGGRHTYSGFLQDHSRECKKVGRFLVEGTSTLEPDWKLDRQTVETLIKELS